MAEQQYTQEHFDKIWEEMAKGRSLKSICKDEGMPTERTVMRRIASDDTIRQQYVCAQEQRADHIFEEILEIADYSAKDVNIVDGMELVNHEAIQRDRLRVDARKWVLGKMSPKKYGDKTAVDVTSGGDKIDNTLIVKHVDMSKPEK